MKANWAECREPDRLSHRYSLVQRTGSQRSATPLQLSTVCHGQTIDTKRRVLVFLTPMKIVAVIDAGICNRFREPTTPEQYCVTSNPDGQIGQACVLRRFVDRYPLSMREVINTPQRSREVGGVDR